MRQAGSKVTLSMIVHNEAERYLDKVLTAHSAYIDEAVIIDDGSTDDTADRCQALLGDIPLKLIRNSQSVFHNEVELRKQQWQETVATQPDWILNMDADECFERLCQPALEEIVQQHNYDTIYFRLYDMWSETRYREDQYWRAHQVYRPFLFRYRPDVAYTWRETPQHCGRFPKTIQDFSYWTHPLRVQHLGWARESDRRMKYERYLKLDGEGIYGWKEQYESILDDQPHTVLWED